MRGALLPHAPLLLPQVTSKAEGLRDIWDAVTRVQVPSEAVVVALTPHAPTGVYRENEGSLVDWIRDPQRAKPGARMPSYPDLDDAGLRALAAYLLQLR